MPFKVLSFVVGEEVFMEHQRMEEEAVMGPRLFFKHRIFWSRQILI